MHNVAIKFSVVQKLRESRFHAVYCFSSNTLVCEMSAFEMHDGHPGVFLIIGRWLVLLLTVVKQRFMHIYIR